MNLHRSYCALGHQSVVALGRKVLGMSTVEVIPNDECRNVWVKTWASMLRRHDDGARQVRGAGRILRLIRDLGEPLRFVHDQLGMDDFDWPGTRRVVDMARTQADVVHCHNLHGGYFDLRLLPELSRAAPTILHLHDSWLTTGHCAIPLNCERWESGCGACPDLSLYPAVKRDSTASNWRARQEIFSRSKVFVAAPSKWLMDRALRSLLAPAIVEHKVIPNGVDTQLFVPGDQQSARAALNLPAEKVILLTVGNGIRTNVWKDYRTLRKALEILGEKPYARSIAVIALGEPAAKEHIGGLSIEFRPFSTDEQTVVQYYQAADMYVHSAIVESFGNTLLEARACGLPVVATAVGGVPEHVVSMRDDWLTGDEGVIVNSNEASGLLVRPGDAIALAGALDFGLNNVAVMNALGKNGRRIVVEHYSLAKHAAAFLTWYAEIVDKHAGLSVE